MKKTVHIISHNHLDREWYMPYAQHHMRLVELFNDLKELFENDPEFKSFHLDGQTIPLDDYLEVYPDMKDTLASWIQDGKLKIGPFYILQDAFLTSSESNARNTLVGLNESLKWGSPVKLGYFPDTFGNVGQTPQMMKQAGLDTVAFGRGVKATGFNNVVIDEESFTSQYSEMTWLGSDKSDVLSILFANWYSNGNEIPTEKEAAKVFWDKKLEEAERYASTSHLLMMNGCDHQPVQKNVSKAIRVARELYPDYEFIHSNFDDYVDVLKESLPDDLGTIHGELTSQESNGWYTLANTASSRVYLKQKNVEVSNMLEQISEPLAVIAESVGKEYPFEMLQHSWKVLMQNHPHDSICGCGVDAIHRGMMSRFETSLEIAKFVRDESLEAIGKAIDTSMFKETDNVFYVMNTQGNRKSGLVEVEIELERHILNQTPHFEAYDKLRNLEIGDFEVVDSQGNNIPFDVVSSETRFDYDLPKDAFRIAYLARFIKVRLSLKDMKPYSWNTYALRSIEGQKEKNPDTYDSSTPLIENDYVRVSVDAGIVSVVDKVNDFEYKDVLHFEDTGDIGNEYIYKMSDDGKIIDSRDYVKSCTITENTELVKVIELVHEMEVPASADKQLRYEQEAIIDITQRKSKRSKEMVMLNISTRIIVERDNRFVKFETLINNNAKDHRVRVLLTPNIQTEKHVAESVFEVIERPNKMGSNWTNPENPQHQHGFMSLSDEKRVMVVGNAGLHEYEVVDNNVAITLFRSVGEMGDWGFFETPEAQCLGNNSYHYSLGFGVPQEKYTLYQNARTQHVDIVSKSVEYHNGTLKPNGQFIDIEQEGIIVTSLKRGETSQDYFVRSYNMKDKDFGDFKVSKEGYTVYESNLIEQDTHNPIQTKIKACEIKTFGLRRKL